MLLLESSMYVSYRQFMIWDASVPVPGLDWTQKHMEQGFARQDSVANVNVLLEFGDVSLFVSKVEAFVNNGYKRVIAIPFRVVTGNVFVEGPEEWGTDRSFSIETGNYCLYVAQKVETDDSENPRLVIECVFCPPCPQDISQIVVADDELLPQYPLLETANIMEV